MSMVIRSRRFSVLAGLAKEICIAKMLGQRKPIFMGLYISNVCNLRCSYCYVNVDDRFDDPARSGLSKDETIQIVDELYDMGTRWIFLLGGEPLMHPDIGSIVRHIVGKGILLHVVTNGTLVDKKIDEIDMADGICISVDGGEAATDQMRGKGCFNRAMRGVDAARSRGMTVRVHAVLNKHSLGDMELLARMGKEKGFTITISPLNYLGKSGDPSLDLTREEYQDFYRRYRRLKEEGYPIGNSFFSIDKALKWPVGYNEYIKKGDSFPHYKPVPCVIGHLTACIDAEGTLFNCIQLGCLNGPNIKEVGLKKAWEELPRRRPGCECCSAINNIETAAYLTLRPGIWMDGFRFFFRNRSKGSEGS